MDEIFDQSLDLLQVSRFLLSVVIFQCCNLKVVIISKGFCKSYKKKKKNLSCCSRKKKASLVIRFPRFAEFASIHFKV